jgi:iron(III) transport system substrate-binding protein
MHLSRRGFALVLLLTGFAAQAESYKLSVYYEGPPTAAREIERAFETFRGDVLSIIPFSADTPEEMDAVAAKADVVWGGGEALHRRLQDAGRIRPYRSSELGAIAAPYWKASPSDVVSGLECMVIAYDPDRLGGAAPPARWRDLLDPRWRGRVAMRNPASGPDSLASASVIVHSLQWSFYESLAAQQPLIVATDDDALARLTSGDALVAVVPYHAVARSTSSLAVIWPTDGAVVTPRPIAILQQDKRPQMMTGFAEQLIDYVLSVEGQIIGRRNGIYPTRVDVLPPPGAPAVALPASGEPVWLEAQPADLGDRLRRLFGSL